MSRLASSYEHCSEGSTPNEAKKAPFGAIFAVPDKVPISPERARLSRVDACLFPLRVWGFGFVNPYNIFPIKASAKHLWQALVRLAYRQRKVSVTIVPDTPPKRNSCKWEVFTYKWDVYVTALWRLVNNREHILSTYLCKNMQYDSQRPPTKISSSVSLHENDSMIQMQPDSVAEIAETVRIISNRALVTSD